MGHEHVNNYSDSHGKSFLVSILINFLIPLAQIIGGLYSGSMALISDAIHNIGDFLALVIAYAAHLIAKQKPTPLHTFGFKRMEVLSAAVNSALLGGSAVFIFIEAISRFLNPKPVNGKIVMILAGVGIIGNGLSAFILHKNSGNNLNMKGAFLHMMGDFMTSAAVMAGAVIMFFKPWYWIDPLLTIIIVFYILFSSLSLLKKSVHLLMDGTPFNIDLITVKKRLEALPSIISVHHIHIWSIASDETALTCHVSIEDQMISSTKPLSNDIKKILADEFNITHTVLQFESESCTLDDLVCSG